MRDSRPVDLLYQLRKSLLYLNKALIASVAAGEVETQREIKKCIDLIKRRIKALSAPRKK